MQDWSNSYSFRVQHWQNITVTACLKMLFPHLHLCAQPVSQLTYWFLSLPRTPPGRCAGSFPLKTSLDSILTIALNIGWFSTWQSRKKVNAWNCTKKDDSYLQKKMLHNSRYTCWFSWDLFFQRISFLPEAMGRWKEAQEQTHTSLNIQLWVFWS